MIAQLLFATGAAIALSGCGTIHATPAPQSYRLLGQDKPIEITGKATSKPGLVTHETDIDIFFDGIKRISGRLDQSYNGELRGSEYDGKPTSATCNSRWMSRDIVEIRCMVFIGNERTVTLTF